MSSETLSITSNCEPMSSEALSITSINLISPKVNHLKFIQKISYYKRHVMLDFVLYHLFMFVVMSLHLLENIKPF
jgi:hypothetical protein